VGVKICVSLSILLLLMEAGIRIENWRAWRWEKHIRREEGDEK
jgi:hypothetical protein